MASLAHPIDCFIFGGGLAGCLLAQTLIFNGKKPLVIDLPEKSRCSQVAAGLINPIGGRRLKLAWKAESLIPFAFNYYEKLESRYRSKFLHRRPLARILPDKPSRDLWRKRSQDPAYHPWFAELESIPLPEWASSDEIEGFSTLQSGYVDIPLLLNSIRKELEERMCLVTTEFDYRSIQLGEQKVNWRNRSAPYAIFCEGHLVTSNPWFSRYPYKPAKGVIGLITTEAPFPETMLMETHFLIPKGDHIQVGATYNWNESNDSPDEEGIHELSQFLDRMLGKGRWEWQRIAAGVRPATAGAKPIVGVHPDFPQLVSFNGFGSKGTSQIPYLAQSLHDHLWRGRPLDLNIMPNRFSKSENSPVRRWIAVEIARDRVLERIHQGDVVVDATAGNGHDTLWLAQRVGLSGSVFAFDVQISAIKATKERLERHGCLSQTQLVHTSHTRLSQVISPDTKVAAIVFNLGYLPGSDRTVTTKPQSTIDALEQSLQLLKPGGLVCIVLYPGHPGGHDETSAIIDWSETLDSSLFQSSILRHPAGIATSPFPMFIEKRPCFSD